MDPSSSSMAENNYPTSSPTEQASQAIVTMAGNENPYEQAPQPNVGLRNPSPAVVFRNPPMSENEPITIRRTARFSKNHHRYTVNFYNRDILVTVTCSARVARNWVAVTRTKIYMHGLRMDRVIAGFGVECSGNNPAASVFQICVLGRCLIFQLQRAHVFPLDLEVFLDSVKLVGIKNGLDEARLWRSRHPIIVLGGLLDLSSVPTNEYRWGLVNASYEQIVDQYLGIEGVRLDNAITTSNWNGPELSLAQVRQATIDAYVSLQIGLKLRAWRFCRRV